jgi:hypothetical protein
MANPMPAASLLHLISEETKELKGAPFTVRSKRTGVDFTYKVTQSVFKDVRYFHVKVEKMLDGILGFYYLGYFRADEGKIFAKGRVPVETPSALAIGWVLRKAFAKDAAALDEGVEAFNLGSCCVCGKRLSDARSIELGIGPVCRGER